MGFYCELSIAFWKRPGEPEPDLLFGASRDRENLLCADLLKKPASLSANGSLFVQHLTAF